MGKIIACAVLAVAVSGCATNAQKIAQQHQTVAAEARDERNQCNAEHESKFSSDMGLIRSKFLINQNDPLKLDKLMDSERPDAAFKKTMLAFWNTYDCDIRWADRVQPYVPAIARETREYSKLRLEYKIKFLQGEFTFGQWNKLSMDMSDEHRKRIAELERGIANEINQMHANELNDRRAKWAAAAQSMQQSSAQANENMQRMLDRQAIQNSLGRPASPTSTVCTPSGNAIICNSF